uniref:G-protein alpha subunit n=1 Tax=Steinernema glaseri TaxID=37863 RepID=A0A1I7Z696_9BILA
MGAVCSSPEVRAALIRDTNITKQLRKDELDEAGNQKLLLLGAGECGKSTILKQMQILHKNGFSHNDLMDKRGIIYSHLITAMAALIKFADQRGKLLSSNDRQQEAKKIFAVLENRKDTEPITPDVYEALKNLWADDIIRESYKMRNFINVPDSTEYFFKELDRISHTDYCPNTQDILHIRVPTTGVVQVSFPIKGCVFRVFDVGGQRSERRKWIHLFDDVNAIIFISAINEYDQVLAEDNSTIRLLESMQLFAQICNCKWFQTSSMILFLNKKDLFLEKIQKTSIKILFENYKGQNTYADSVRYIRKKFLKLNNTPQTKKIYMHETCATDTNQVQLVIDSVIDIVIGKNLRGTGME